MIIGITGPRPKSIGGYKVPNPTYNYICKELKKVFLDKKPDYVITGLALGVDSWAAKICIDLNIPYIAAIPFPSQDSIWPDKSKQIYKILLKKAYEVVATDNDPFMPAKLFKRNEYIVDNCDLLVAVFDPNQKSEDVKSGTSFTVNYALSQDKNIYYINPNF